MTPKRKKAQDFILEEVKTNSMATFKIMSNLFDSLDDKGFDTLMKKIRDDKTNLSYIISPEEGVKISERDLIARLKTLGINVMQKLTYFDEELGEYTAPIEVVVLDVTCKRASQMVDKKMALPEGNKTSVTTGQPSGSAKTSKITMPEALINIGFGSKESITEVMNIRGGNLGASVAMDKLLYDTGEATIENVSKSSTGVVSKDTLNVYFKASHLKSTL